MNWNPKAVRKTPLALTIAAALLAASKTEASSEPSPEQLQAKHSVPRQQETQYKTGLAGIGDSLGLSPYWDWRTIESEHFRVTFPAELADIAQKTTQYYEEAHRLLSPLFKWDPWWKVQVVVVDNTDLANGLTSATLRLGMVLMVTPPENWFSTAYYDDWLRLLVIHEYTHFLNMDTTRGFWKVARYVFGDSLLPNSVWPSWMLEGLAVYMETRFTRSGRGRSPYYEMILRAAVEADALDSAKFITLDKINGPNPWPPGGETAYLFGYELMNQVAKESGDVLGEMSWRSGKRFPWLINGNLENITGKDWYDFWDDFVRESRSRMSAQLEKIRSQPVTRVDRLTEGDLTLLGSAASPDGRWIAYTQSSPDQRMGLFIKDLKSGDTKRITDKFEGASLSFTPDSKTLIYSSVARRAEYYLWSDLAAYDLVRGSTSWLTNSLRLRDPSVSPDGKWVVVTLTDGPVTGLAVAPLEKEDGKYHVGTMKRIFWPERFDRVSTPKFTADGSQIVFSLKKNGEEGENLMRIRWDAGRDATAGTQPETLVADGRMNRFPAISGSGKIYYVSDLTGVDNVYEYRGKNNSVLVTNITTGLAFPTFHGEQLYANVFSYRGWDLARIETGQIAIPASQARDRVGVPAAPPPYPRPAPESSEKISGAPKGREQIEEATKPGGSPRTAETDYPVKRYSPYPSILPRQWAPLLYASGDSTYVGAQALGFDAIDVHRYLLVGAYETQTRNFDYGLAYTNRQLGPAITLTASEETKDQVTLSGDRLMYTRDRDYSASVSYPFLWTYSSLTPIVTVRSEREKTIVRSDNPALPSTESDDPYIPKVSGLLVYTDAESSALAISPERGRTVLLGSQVALERGGATPVKNYFQDTEYVHLLSHTVLVPSLRATYTTNPATPEASYEEIARGRRFRVLDPFLDDPFEEVPIRGYPGRSYSARSILVGGLDYRFPLLRIFRGWGTNPLFFENIWGFVFGEATYFPSKDQQFASLPSAGGGVRASLEALTYIPLVLSVEYHYGFRREAGGKGDLFGQISLGVLNF